MSSVPSVVKKAVAVRRCRLISVSSVLSVVKKAVAVRRLISVSSVPSVVKKAVAVRRSPFNFRLFRAFRG
jgi:hypothetical protein